MTLEDTGIFSLYRNQDIVYPSNFGTKHFEQFQFSTKTMWLPKYFMQILKTIVK